jgi:hypothetical protein
MSFIDAENLFKDIAESVRLAYKKGEISDYGIAMRRVEKMEAYFRGDYTTLWRMERDERIRAEEKMTQQRLGRMLPREVLAYREALEAAKASESEINSVHEESELLAYNEALEAAKASESEIHSVHEEVHHLHEPISNVRFTRVLNPEDVSIDSNNKTFWSETTD